jgi:threonine dehydratase
MPTIAPLAKVQRCRQQGANVILHGDTISDAREECMRRDEWKNLTYINGFNDLAVIAGAGTCGLEIAEQVPHFDAVVIPCGGGGLLAGVGLALKTLRPDCKVSG